MIQLRLRERHRIARTHHAAHVFQHRDFRESVRPAPAIDCHAQCLAHSDILEGFACCVEHDQQIYDPTSLENADTVLHLLKQLGLFRWVPAAELSIELTAQNPRNNSIRLNEEGFVAVEVGLALIEVVSEAFAFPAYYFRASSTLACSRRC